MLSVYNNCNYLLRKTKSFNKSRYSRNRQYYRTGVFLCLWANIIFLIGSYYTFFRLTFKFSYLFIILLSTFSLVLFSYYSRNLSIGLIHSFTRLMNNLSVCVITYFILLCLRAKVIIRLHSLNLFKKSIISAYPNQYTFSLFN